ncbi:MAG TPA: glycerate kinase, partial [Candidatus Limnocylindrales bacterium]|nr:glycerate kinase [Candidatus Limnocylindrales bacterium]
TRVTDPIGREIDGAWLERRGADGVEAVIELATASGLSRLGSDERDPQGATTRGTGELILAAVDAGARSLTLGIGGSATNDGGRGILEALGGRVGADGSVDLASLDVRLAEVDLRVACDVDNPLLGSRGAAATYGPQKGASPEDVRTLEGRLGGWADTVDAATGRQERETAGAGAAGGVGYVLLALQDRFRSFALQPGIELVMAATGFNAALADADLVLTGEGRVDAQTAFGKTALGVARRASEADVRCIAIGGGVTAEGIDALTPFGTIVIPIVERPMSVEEAMAAGPAPIERCAERIARLVDVGGRLTAGTSSPRGPGHDRISLREDFDEPLPAFREQL